MDHVNCCSFVPLKHQIFILPTLKLFGKCISLVPKLLTNIYGVILSIFYLGIITSK